MPDSSRTQLIEAARCLRPLLHELVFVGGAVTGLLISDPAAAAPRTTFDVDAIAEITTYAEYVEFAERLRALGFSEDTRAGAPLCRWMLKGTTLDLMPLDEDVLGFSNRWYRVATETAVPQWIADDLEVRIVTAPIFLATKLDAFYGRGNGDFFTSHDLEDFISVIDGHPAIVEEVRNTTPEARSHIGEGVAALLRTREFLDALPGYLLPDAISQRRIVTIRERLNAVAVL